MALEIIRQTAQERADAQSPIVADRTLHVTADRMRLVEETHPDVAFVLVGKGHRIPVEDVERMSLIVIEGKVMQKGAKKLTDEDLLSQFEAEAVVAGYKNGAPSTIARARLRALREGISYDEAHAAIHAAEELEAANTRAAEEQAEADRAAADAEAAQKAANDAEEKARQAAEDKQKKPAENKGGKVK